MKPLKIFTNLYMHAKEGKKKKTHGCFFLFQGWTFSKDNFTSCYKIYCYIPLGRHN